MIPRYQLPEIAELFTDDARYGTWLEIEVLATDAWEKLGVVPSEDATAIRERAGFTVAEIDERERTKRPALFRGIMLSGAGAVMIALVMGALNADIEWILAAVQMCVLGGITYAVARRLEYYDGDPDTFTLVMAGFSAKLWGSLVRMLFTTIFYSGVADATEYDQWGRWLRRDPRHQWGPSLRWPRWGRGGSSRLGWSRVVSWCWR